jgi:uncharacterized protein
MEDYKNVMDELTGKQARVPVKILVLDVLKPHKPNILDFGKKICTEKTIEAATISVYAVDEKTESLKIVLEGRDIDFDKIRDILEDQGGVIHSMDKVVLGRKTSSEASAISEIGKY